MYLANLSETKDVPRSPVSTRALVVMNGCAWEPVKTCKFILAPVSFQALYALSTALWSVLVAACLKTEERLVERAELSDLVFATMEGVRESIVIEIVRLAMSLFMSIEVFAPVISFG